MKKIFFYLLLSFYSFTLHGQTVKLCGCGNEKQAMVSKVFEESTVARKSGKAFNLLENLYRADSAWSKCIRNSEIEASSLIGKSLPPELLAEVHQKVLVLNFWYMACAPCIKEFPDLNRIVEEYSKNEVVFLALTSDKDETKLSNFLKENTFLFHPVLDAKEAISNFCISGFPTTFIISKDGIIEIGWMGTKDKSDDSVYQRIKKGIDSVLSKNH
ncbi:TlpA family protein disulfide reductase [Fibrella aquatica]|uniref:TlpA family protein disulfide reductase n=1 Tax=Fibrella aquatica TaxID=3242487 RepID=UPI0035203414